MNQKSENPWRDLFLWAVLQNRHKMAHLFWAMGPEGVAAALAACQIVREMSRLETEAEVVRRMKEAKYEQLAVELFSDCYHDSEERAFALLVRKNRYWGKTTCLHLATEADAKSFFAHDGVQAPPVESFLYVLSEVMYQHPDLNLSQAEGVPCLETCLSQNTSLNLVKLREETQSDSFKDLGSLDTERTLLSYTKKKNERINIIDVNLQSSYTDGGMNLIKKFKLYVEDNWNKCDMLAISLFIIGIACRMFNSTFHDGRTVLAIDFMVFTLRLIHIFAIHKQLGPKIIIVERMMKDVFFFLFFLSVWLIAYGVATEALLHPDDSRAEWIFRRVLYRPYLQIFGQIPLDKIDSSRMDFGNCTLGQQRNQTASDFSCPSAYANWLVIILLVIFLLVTNVLLMNLLIAMFRQLIHAERDIPEDLDQKLITWELLQKENYLANLEIKKKESNEEKLKKMSDK
ncbi:hypothetical protein Chor_016377 [Crotalus horridus]